MWPFRRRRTLPEDAVLGAFMLVTEAVRTAEIRITRTMTTQFDALKAAVEAQDDVINSAITLLTNLGAQIRQKADDPAALTELASEIETKSKALADAVAANTIAAPNDATAAVGGAGDQAPNGAPNPTVLDGQPLDTDNPAFSPAADAPVTGDETDATKIEPAAPIDAAAPVADAGASGSGVDSTDNVLDDQPAAPVNSVS